MKIVRILLMACIFITNSITLLYAQIAAAYVARPAVVSGNSVFAIDLYNELKSTEGNLFFSPYSISTALAMTYAGARGNTERQMADVLHFTLSQEKLHPEFAVLATQLNEVQRKGNVELNIANALWAQEGHKFLDEFIALTNHYYSAGLNRVDFKTDTEAARKKINAWIEDKTKNKIKDLIPAGMLDDLTRLVLTNAIYFKGTWETQFNKRFTKDEKFWLSEDNLITAPLMFQKEVFSYMENENLQMLELPYKGNDLSMIVLLPKEKDGLSDLESTLSTINLDAWTRSMTRKEILVYLPKFKMISGFKLAETLKAMGMPDAFGPLADFSGMDGITDPMLKLFISEVIHKAFVDVYEEGTEAAAATAVTIFTTAMAPSEPPIFRADHPFIFLIRHNPTGSILFLGRLVDPRE